MSMISLEAAQALVQALGGPELDADGDSQVVGTDGQVINIHYDGERERLLVLTVLGELPEDAGLSLSMVRTFLAANLLWAASHGKTFALDDEANTLIMQDVFTQGETEDFLRFMNDFAADYTYFAEIFSRLPEEIDEYENS